MCSQRASFGTQRCGRRGTVGIFRVGALARWASVLCMWLRSVGMDGEIKHVVYGVLVLGSIHLRRLRSHIHRTGRPARRGADPEDPDEYRAARIFWVPKEARWEHIKASAPQPTIEPFIDEAMAAIERDNASLKGCCPKTSADGPRQQRLGQIINLVSASRWAPAPTAPKTPSAASTSTSSPASPAPRARAAGSLHAQQRRPPYCRNARPLQRPRLRSLLRLRGMFVSSEKSSSPIAAGSANISIYGQRATTPPAGAQDETSRSAASTRRSKARRSPSTTTATRTSRPTTSSPTRVHGQRLRGDLLKNDGAGLSASRPPATPTTPGCSTSSITSRQQASRVRLRHGSMSSSQSGEGEIRKSHHRSRPGDCMVALPGQLFYSTTDSGLPLVPRPKQGNGRFRDRRGETLFIDARQNGHANRPYASRA